MVASPSPFFNVGNNKTSTKHFATLFGEERVTTDEKDVFIQKQNSVVSSKALVLVNCLNTFVHDCRLCNVPLFEGKSNSFVISELN